MQRRCKHAFPTLERLCFLRDSCKVVIKKSWDERSRVKFRDASLPGYELGSRGIDLNRVFGIGNCRITVRRELGYEKKTSYVIWSYSETVINPLPGYDQWRLRTLVRVYKIWPATKLSEFTFSYLLTYTPWLYSSLRTSAPFTKYTILLHYLPFTYISSFSPLVNHSVHLPSISVWAPAFLLSCDLTPWLFSPQANYTDWATAACRRS
jgi:hypothetical protein